MSCAPSWRSLETTTWGYLYRPGALPRTLRTKLAHRKSAGSCSLTWSDFSISGSSTTRSYRMRRANGCHLSRFISWRLSHDRSELGTEPPSGRFAEELQTEELPEFAALGTLAM